MANIIRLHRDPHRDTQQLLPWYVTGRLDPADHDLVAAHLSDCAQCREELATERELAAGIAGLVLDGGADFSVLRRRIAPIRHEQGRRGAAFLRLLAWPGKFGWLLAGQVALAASVAMLLLPQGPPAPYHALGSTVAARPGNVIVIFRPDSREENLRRLLTAQRARLVDGPTAAGAYVLQVAPQDRDMILKALRGQQDIVLAQPLDGEGQP
ncbi:anti-sigma factor [Sphingobium sp. EM0848]|uniref:anti-sigma factor family protein n=1 Tax=Sphingobium sp. EM0848 TaxID=2743473 RepID=UPI00159C9CA9|nr:zf-HC2 domain-containing protein [Sphingobium sp. EM0848]